MSLRVSVVIPTYRRPGLLARCLAAVLAQDLAPGEYEVIVVDDEPSEATRRVVELYAAGRAREAVGEPAAVGGNASARLPEQAPRVRYLTAAAHGPAAARNAGWRAAEADVIAFTDDDCIAAPDWLRCGLDAIDGIEARADGVAGRIVVPRGQPPTDYEAMIGRLEHAPFVTANCFYRRDALVAVDGFDERFTTAWREDSDLQFKLIEAGARLVTTPDAVVTHPVRRAPWGISVREQRKSLFNALLFKKHPRLYREQIQARPPWRYLGIVAALFAAAGGLLARRRWVALLGGLGWLAQTAAFAAMRLRGTSHRPGHVLEIVVTSAVIPPLSLYWRLRGALKFRVLFI